MQLHRVEPSMACGPYRNLAKLTEKKFMVWNILGMLVDKLPDNDAIIVVERLKTPPVVIGLIGLLL